MTKRLCAVWFFGVLFVCLGFLWLDEFDGAALGHRAALPWAALLSHLFCCCLAHTPTPSGEQSIIPGASEGAVGRTSCPSWGSWCFSSGSGERAGAQAGCPVLTSHQGPAPSSKGGSDRSLSGPRIAFALAIKDRKLSLPRVPARCLLTLGRGSIAAARFPGNF